MSARMGDVATPPVNVEDHVRLADAVAGYLDAVTSPNTRRGYAVVLNRLCRDFGLDSSVARLDPERLRRWFECAWGQSTARTYNVRLAGLRAACDYWRRRNWLAGDPLVRMFARPIPHHDNRALTRAQVAEVLGLDVRPRDRVLWRMLYETAAHVEELLALNVPALDPDNRAATITREGGAADDVIVWQPGTAQLLSRMLAGRRSGPLYLTDRMAKRSTASADVDPTTGHARLSYRRAAELFNGHTARLVGGPFMLHQLRHSALTHAAEDGASTATLLKMFGHTSVRGLARYIHSSASALDRGVPRPTPPDGFESPRC